MKNGPVIREAAKHGAAKHGEAKVEAAKNGAVRCRPVKLGAENTSMEQCKWNRKERSGNHAEAKHGVRRYETATDMHSGMGQQSME